MIRFITTPSDLQSIYRTGEWRRNFIIVLEHRLSTTLDQHNSIHSLIRAHGRRLAAVGVGQVEEDLVEREVGLEPLAQRILHRHALDWHLLPCVLLEI